MTVNENLQLVKPALRQYIESNILPQYSQNDWGHNADHINYVIRRSLKFAATLPASEHINFDIVYAVAAYHDLGHHIDAKHHEQVSAQMLRADQSIQEFFSPADIITIAEAIEDHRSHLDHPVRSIYGKIIASADCNINIDVMMHRTFTYRLRNFSEKTLKDIITESRQHLLRKYGKEGYAKNKMHFDDPEFAAALRDVQEIVNDEATFLQRYLQVNHLEYSYQQEQELSSYLNNINQELRQYVEQNILPQYAKNDKAHGILHIREVIRRSFLLNQVFDLRLNSNMIYVVAAYHDFGKHIDSDRHEFISADLFRQDQVVHKFFSDAEQRIIAEAIEDHRSSRSDSPRSVYGKLISSADRNTRVELVCIRSFFVGQDRQPKTVIADFLDTNFQRLVKRYSLTDPENMFYADEEYQNFLAEMRRLLQNQTEFSEKFCAVNHITSREHTLADEPGVETYCL